MSSRKTGHSRAFSLPIAEFQYRQMVPAYSPVQATPREEIREIEVRHTEEALQKRIAVERAQAISETEARLSQEFEQRSRAENVRVSRTIETFEQSRKEYFARVESEVVQLALAIAGKILHREAQVDPLLVAAIVQIALGQLKEGSSAVIRVRPEDAERWRGHFDSAGLNVKVSVVEDDALEPNDCILETELGSVNFSLDMQLKEVEKGFLDVLAQKPRA